jgi:MFS family permease
VTRRAPLRGLFAAEAVSTLGSRMTLVALPWFVLVTTGSPLLMGVVGLAEMLPYVVAQLLAGPLVDRVGPRRASLTADALSTVAVGAVPLASAAGRLPFAALLALVAVADALRGPGDAAKRVLLPRAVEASAVPMERAAGLSDGISRTASLVGAPLGGVLVGVLGAPAVLAVDAATFAAGAALVAVLLPRDPRPERAPAGYGGELRTGLRFLLGDPLLRAIALMIALTNTIDAALSGVLLPLWAADAGGPAVLGLVSAVFAGCAAAGTVVAGLVGARLPRRRTFALCFVVGGAPRIAALALGLPLPGVLAVTALGGLACGAINPLLAATEYERIPARLQARVLGASGALGWAGIPFGGLLGGALAERAGLAGALALAAASYLAVTLLPFVHGAWHGMDRRTPVAQPAAAGRPAPPARAEPAARAGRPKPPARAARAA